MQARCPIACARWLSDPSLAHDHHHLLASDEVAGGEVDDLGLRDVRVEGEVELLERLVRLEGRAPQPEIELLLIASLDLVLQRPVQELRVGQAVLHGLTVRSFNVCSTPRRRSFFRIGTSSSVGLTRTSRSGLLRTRENRGRVGVGAGGAENSVAGSGPWPSPLRRMSRTPTYV
jgi:hypothetical protein